MADDGMLMNFSVGDAPLKPAVAFKGGRWKDRLHAKKSAQGRPRSSTESPHARKILGGNTYQGREEYVGPEGDNASRPAKRPRFDDQDSKYSDRRASWQSRPERNQDDSRRAPVKSFASGKLPPGSINVGGRGNRKGGDKQFISSLFTFNPATKTTFEDSTENITEEAKPSNAPLSEEMSNFINLGLSKRLAAHLSNKLEMKAPTAIQKAAVTQMVKDDSDAFIQAQTGSGKTLAYLLPIVERIMALSTGEETRDTMKISRSSGLFAIVLAPTRELCKQISVVLEKLLRCAPWIVGTTVIGGESKKSEKARLRKGVNILIATPGRLADHLDNTEVLNVSTVRWLVLDEGDRLMEMGFEEEIKGIVDKIRKQQLVTDKLSKSATSPGLPSRRITVLCSATMQMNVQRLGEISLEDAVHIQADPSEESTDKLDTKEGNAQDTVFSAPAQLKQSYAVVPAKLRLVALTAILKRAFARRGSTMKAIVFISCADSVDFHFSAFSRSERDKTEEKDQREEKTDKRERKEKRDKVSKKSETEESVIADGPTSPDTPAKPDLTKDTRAPATAFSNTTNSVILHKLHGSLPQNVRTATLKSFANSKEPSILLCTDVASRGLDLPNVDLVIEYDPAFSADDHLHRIGRTARAGRAGRALIFLQPGSEEGYISILSASSKNLTGHSAEDVLAKGFGGTGREWEERATEWQLEAERWALEDPKILEMARRAFQSHIRAYATHIAAERSIFDMQTLHLGHMAKAFALRDRPGSINVPGMRPGKPGKRGRGDGGHDKAASSSDAKGQSGGKKDDDSIAARMRKKMREHMSSAAEFNIG